MDPATKIQAAFRGWQLRTLLQLSKQRFQADCAEIEAIIKNKVESYHMALIEGKW